MIRTHNIVTIFMIFLKFKNIQYFKQDCSLVCGVTSLLKSIRTNTVPYGVCDVAILLKTIITQGGLDSMLNIFFMYFRVNNQISRTLINPIGNTFTILFIKMKNKCCLIFCVILHLSHTLYVPHHRCLCP